MSAASFAARRKYELTDGASRATDARAARLIHRAAFGATPTEIAAVRAAGYQAWVEEQLSLTTRIPITDLFTVLAQPEDEATAMTSATHHMFVSNQQLLVRAAYVWNTIFNLNLNSGGAAFQSGVRLWPQVLVDNAFGNYRTLIEAVSKSAFMGVWLSFKGNPKATATTQPDENYAREIMQLFSIGLWELNQDGTRIKTGELDPGDPRYVLNGTDDVPTYTLADVRGLARVFTGWSGTAGFDSGTGYGEALDGPMIQYPAFHETGTKEFLGVTIPADTDGQASLTIALDTLFNHPCTPPFISKIFIQRMVTSNPSPQYVARVAAAFIKDPITGVRGDLRAMLRAVLLDQEALTPSVLESNTFGRVKEPFVSHVSRHRSTGTLAMVAVGTPGFSGAGFTSSAGFTGGNMGANFVQHFGLQPSVFGHFLNDHSPAGEISEAGLIAPEMQMFGEGVTLTEASFRPNYNNDFTKTGFLSTSGGSENLWDYTVFQADATSDVTSLVDRLIIILAPEQISPATRTEIIAAVNAISSVDWQYRIAFAWQLITSSINFWVQR